MFSGEIRAQTTPTFSASTEDFEFPAGGGTVNLDDFVTHNAEEVYPGDWQYSWVLGTIPNTIQVDTDIVESSFTVTIKNEANRYNPDFTYSFTPEIRILRKDSLRTPLFGNTATASGTGKGPRITFSPITVPVGGGTIDVADFVTHNAEDFFPGNWMLGTALNNTTVPDTITVSQTGNTLDVAINSAADRSNPEFTYSFDVRIEVARAVPYLTLQEETVTVSGTGVALPAPTAVTATAGDGEIEVGWAAVADETNLVAYVVCRVAQADAATAALAEADCDAVAAGGTGDAAISAATSPFTLTAADHLDGDDSNGTAYFVFVQANYGDAIGRSAWVAAATNPVTPMVPASTDATLSVLTLTDIPITFATAMTSYTADVAATVTTTTVTATPSDDNATVAITSDRDTTIGANGEVDLAVGANAITITVTAEDTTTTETYTVTVNRDAPSTDATLTDLSLSDVTLAPAFDAAVMTYTATVANDIATTTVTATPAAGASVTVTDDGMVNLNVGPNTITLTVTAEDTTTTETYTVTVMRDAADTVIPDPTPEPEPTVDRTPDAFTFTPQSNIEPGTMVTSNTITVTGLDDGVSVPITVSGGTINVDDGMVSNDDTVTVTVTAECGTVTATVTIGGVSDDFTVTSRVCGSDSSLASLAVMSMPADRVTLVPAFNANTRSYTAEITVTDPPVEVTSITVAATANPMVSPAESPTVTGNGESITPATVTLTGGRQTVTITVTAEDGSSTEYTITVGSGAELTEAAEASLPTVTRAIVGQISNAISGRINSAVTNSFSGINLANLNDETVLANFIANNEMNAKQILANNDFVLPLNAGGGASGISSLSLWASGGIGGVNDDHNTADWDGDYSNANIGLDAKVSDDLLIGLALSSTQTDIDYKDSAAENDNGKYELNLTGVHPYIAFNNNGVTFSASIGEADGELEIDNETKHDADLKTVTIAAGIPLSSGNLQPNLTAELTESELSINDDNNTKTNANTAKINVAIAPTIGRLQSNLQLGINFDTGDGKTGTAAEFRAGVSGGTERVKASAELHLIDGDREWGISGSLRLSPGNDGQGLSLTMQPTYSNKMELTTHLAYGIGEVTPYLNATTNKTEYGLQWQPTKQVKLKLQNEKTKTDNAIKLTTEINF